MPPTPAVQDKQKLAPKESTAFKNIVRLYDKKAYKKGVKACDNLLKIRPDHGETMAMRALIHSGMGKKEEAHVDAKKAIALNLNSFLCWHAYGLVHRADRNYAQAIKCYQNALKRESDTDRNQVYRDMATLQMQIRDIEGYTDTWRKLLKDRPNTRTNWICFAIGEHLLGHFEKALSLLDAYLSTTDRRGEAYEVSELLMYRNQLLEESGKYQEAYDDLFTIEKDVLDKISLKEKKAELLTKLGRFGEGVKEWEELLNENPDNHKYHRGFQRAHQLPEKREEWTDLAFQKFKQLYDSLKEKYPKSDAVVYFPLHCYQGEDLKNVLEEYAKKKIRRGVPSLFQDLVALYSHSENVPVVESLFQSFQSNLQKTKKFSEKEEKEENPDAWMWVSFYLSQHFNHLGNYGEALALINQVIEHTPTLIESYLVKASILKNGGDPEGAALAANYAREMDLADRYLNNETAKFQFYAGQHEKALKTLSLFTKEGEDPGDYLDDMQAMWYETSIAKSYRKNNNLPMTLKKLLPVHKHFDDIIDDQLDFHSYCLRKMTLRSYVHMIRMEDSINSHHFYVRGMKPLIETYIQLHDNPFKSKAQLEKEKEEAMSDAERKKYITKKKAAERRQKEEEEKKKVEVQKGKVESKRREDTDPEGEALAIVEDKLKEANKYLSLLKRHASKVIQVHLLSFEVSIRSKKYLLALQSLVKAHSLQSSHPTLHLQIIRFFRQVAEVEMSGVTKEIVEQGKQKLLGGKSLLEFNNEFLESNKNSYIHRVSAAESLLLLDSSKQPQVISLLSNLENARGRKDLKGAISTLSSLSKIDAKAANDFKAKANQTFPLARAFMSDSQLAALNPKEESSEENL